MPTHPQQEKPGGLIPPGIFLASRYPDYRQWLPVGYLTREHVSSDNAGAGFYIFSYVEAARRNNLPAVWGGEENWSDPPNWEALYVSDSDKIPPPFCWRVRPESRPDYDEYMEALDLTREQVRANPFLLLARNEGRKVTDWYETFAKPVPRDGRYDIPFFLRGLGDLLKNGKDARLDAVVERVKALQPDEKLLLMPDPQNPADPNAVAVRTADKMLVGYCPPYLAREFRRFLAEDGTANANLKVRVRKVNPNGSLSLMLLCRLTCNAVPGFAPCEDADFRILSPEMRERLTPNSALIGRFPL